MGITLAGVFVVVAFMFPVGVYALCILIMGTHPSSGRYGNTSEQFFESPYQPMRILTGRQPRTEAPAAHVEPAETQVAA